MIQKQTHLLSLFLFISVTNIFAQSRYNFDYIDALHYTFEIEISDKHDKILGNTSLLFRTKQAFLDTLYLDFIAPDESGKGMKVLGVLLNEKVVDFNQTDEHLIITLDTRLENNYTATLHITYEGIPNDGLIIAQNEYGDRTFFGDNWPNRARNWLPVIDHPSDKATCEFKITAPDHYKVIANGILREESYLGNVSNEKKKLSHWVSSQPIATKVMVFGAADFAVLYEKPVLGIPIQYWVYADNRESSFTSFEATPNILHFLSQYIGDYPYEKLANVESKTKYGGMENASNIFYSEQVIEGNHNIEGLIAHETAHQWFGNAISEKSWEHIWLSEGLSTYLSHLYLEATYGSDTLISLLKDDENRIFSYYRKEPTSTVVNINETNLFRLLNANSYQKGSWFLHMLRQKLGDDIFQKCIRNYYKQKCNSSAETADFKMVMEKVSGKNLDTFFDQWLNYAGHPVIEGTWKYSSLSKKLKVELKQTQSNGQLYQLPIEIGVYYDENDTPEIHKLTLDQTDQSFTFKLNDQPKTVVLDPLEKILIETHFVNK